MRCPSAPCLYLINTGGLVGSLWNGSISDSSAAAVVSASSHNMSVHVGGLAGYASNISIIDSHAMGAVNAIITNTDPSSTYVGTAGGLV